VSVQDIGGIAPSLWVSLYTPEYGIGEVSACCVGAGEICVAQICACQIRIAQISRGEIST
jgi:hypothetical protein